MKKTLLGLFFTCAFGSIIAQPATALNFDGTNDNVRRGTVSTLTAGLTYEARINWGGVAPSARYIMYNGTNGTNGVGIYLASGSTSLSIKNGAIAYNSSVTIPTGSMTMISVVVQGPNGMSLYINGAFVQSFFPPPVPALSTGSFAIGSDDAGGNNFNGTIDEVRYWNRALCAAEIAHRFNCEAIGTEPNLVALYHFNQGIDAGNNATVTTLMDSSPSSFSATLNNFTLTGATSNWIAAAGSLSTTCTYAPNSVTITPAGPASVCAGNSVALTATGAFTYTWNPGALTGSMVVITPTASGIYTVLGNSGNCYGVGGKSVTVNALPSLTVASTSSVLCIGQSATLTGSGAASYTWNPGGTGSVIVVSPTVNSTYTVSITGANSCTNSAQYTQSVTVCGGIHSLSNLNSDVRVFPNPNNGDFAINLNSVSENTTIEIYNSIGQLVLTEKVNSLSTKINIAQMPKGIYVLRLKENNAIIKTTKIVKD